MDQSRPESMQSASNKRNITVPLQTRLVLFVLITALVPLIFIAIRDILQTQKALTNNSETSLISNAEQTATSLDYFIQKTLDSVEAEAQLEDLKTFLNLSQAARTRTLVRNRTLNLLKNLSKKDEENIISYALVDEDGNVLLDSNTDLQYNESDEAYFSQVRFADGPIVTSVTYLDDKTTALTFASKILNDNGDFIGALRVKYNSKVLQSLVTSSSGGATAPLILLLDEYYIRLADNRNQVLIQKSIVPLNLVNYLQAVDTKRFLDIPREEQSTNFVDFAYALDNASAEPFFRVDITPPIAGDDTVAVAFMDTKPWLVTFSQPTSVFLAEVQKQTRTNTILVVGVLILITIVTTIVSRSLTNPIISLTNTANSISSGDLSARAAVTTTDEIGLLGSTFNLMTDQLQSTLIGLEQRIDERTADLRKNALELKTIADVSREISTIRDLDTLLNVSVNLIRERFNYYHVGIFLVDERNEYAILRAASSVAAELMLSRNYKLRVGQTGLVGNVTKTGRAYIALDVGTDAVHFENPLLPETKSEIALPLLSHNITIGALDIQANTPTAFDDEDVQTLQILADQLTAAIENAQLTRQVEDNLAVLTAANRFQTQQVWRSAINLRGRPAYEYDGLQIKAVPSDLPMDLMKQLETGNPIVINQETDNAGKKARNILMIPLLVFNQVIGVIGLEQEDASHIWTSEEIAIAQAAANRAALTLENARLLDESQRRANKERTISESTARIGSATNIENILNTTVEEIERVLNTSEIILQFTNIKES
jgi:GAF domain-containing protein/HAMP domain-containing protein